MKLGIISDLHIDINDRGQKRLVGGLARVLREQGVSYFLTAGDVSNNYRLTIELLLEIEQLSGVKCLFVPGNHDIWNIKYPKKSSWEIYEELKEFSGNLARGPVSLNEDWVVMGDMGWYDFSFGDKSYSEADFEQMEYKEMLWQDKIFANWGMSSREVHRYFYDKLQHQLKEAKGKKIITLTHAVPHNSFTVPTVGREIWKYFNGFLGSQAYGELFIEHGVQYAVFGHVHYRNRKQVGDTTLICNSLGYTREWWYHQDNPEAEVRRAFKWIEI